MKIKLRTKLTAFLVAFIVFSILATLLSSLLNFRLAQREAVLEIQMQKSLASAEKIAHFLSLQLQALREVELLLFPEFEQDTAFRDKLLQRILFRHDDFVDLVLTAPEGQELIRHNRYKVIREQDLINRSQDEEFQTAKEQGYYLGPLYFEQGRPLLKLAASVIDPAGELKGLIIADIDMRIMQDAVKRVSAAEGPGRVYIVNKEGVVVAHPDVSLILRQENLSSVSPLVADLIRGGWQELVPGLRTAVNVYRNEAGQEVVGAGAPIKISLSEFEIEPQKTLSSDWFVVSELPSSVAFARVRDMTVFALLILAAILLASIVAVFLLAKRIVRPIEKVHTAARQLGGGNLDYRAEVNTGDEIEDLAKGFNQMAEKLKKTMVALEEEKASLTIRVEARTHELKELAESLEERVKERTKELQERLQELERFQRLVVGRELKMIELKKEIEKLKKELNKGRK